MKKRSQIQDKYKWKTSDIYASEELLLKDIDEIKNHIEVVKTYKGKLNNKKTILEFLNMEERLDLIGEKVGSYLFLNHSEKRACGQAQCTTPALKSMGKCGRVLAREFI